MLFCQAFVLFALVWTAQAAVEDTLPNFVVFFIDDFGWGDLGANVDDPLSDTPNMDALAAGSVLFQINDPTLPSMSSSFCI